MKTLRYRIGINHDKLPSWSGWYSDYELAPDAAEKLALQIERDMDKFRIYEVKPNKDILPETRREIVKNALLILLKKYSE